jgi:small GTP-binding protein
MKVIQAKICTVGDFSVGKTSLVRRYVEGIFDDKYLSSIGVWITRKRVELSDNAINMIVWDLASGEDFQSDRSSYLRGAAGAIVVCDLSRSETLIAAEKYYRQLEMASPNVDVVLLGNKADLVDAREVSDESLHALAAELNCSLFLTSAKMNSNVNEVFQHLAHEIVASNHQTQG